MDWKDYWNKNADFYEKIARFYRRNLFALEGKIYTEKYFSDKGYFVECGSGTSECSVKISKKNRYGISLDLCIEPLKKVNAPIVKDSIQGTIFNLPFKNETIDGIWNFGVMEHFKEDELNNILKEFNRVIKNEGKIVLFWPWIYSPLGLRFSFKIYIEKLLKNLGIKMKFDKSLDAYPDAYTVFKYKEPIRKILENCGFSNCEFKLSPYGLFSHYVVKAEK